MNQFHSASPPPQGVYMQGQYVVMQGQQPVTNQYPPPGSQFNGNGNGNLNGNGMHQQSGSPPPGHDGQPGVYMSRQAMKAPVGHQQVAFPPGTPPGMPSPSMMSNGQFAPPPGWKMESSQLQQPLTTQRHRPSPSISSLRQQNQSYEIDKETGLSTRPFSPPAESPIDTRLPGQPALVQSAGQSSQQNGFQPPNPPYAQQQQQHQQQSPTLARTSTSLTQDSQHHDEHDGRRTSNMFTSIRSRLAGNGTDRPSSMGGRAQGNGVTEDGVSEASIPIEGQGRGAAKFFGLGGYGQPASEGAPRPSQDMRGSSPPPVGGAPFSPPREKRSLFTRPSGPGTGTQSAQEFRRPSTAEGATSQAPIVGFGPGQPKKRFSKLTGMLNRDNKTEGQLSQPQGQPTFMHGQRPSFQGQRTMPPGVPMGAPGQMGHPGGPGSDHSMSDFVRPRSATAGATGGARPSISDHSRSPSAQGFGSPPPMGAIREEERGRKPSGNFLAGIFGKRSESRTRDQRPSQSPSGLGQPQSMNPQGQMMMGHRPVQSGSFLPIQGQTLNMQGQPMAPPQGQYAGLINQAQQQFLGQPGRQGLPNNQVFMQGQNLVNSIMNQQGQPSPGISPVTQSSGSPMATQPQGGIGSRQPPTTQQGQQGYTPQRPQDQPPSLGVVQVATAVPIRQVSNSPNGNTGQISAGPSPGGQSDSSRQRSASVVNQIEVGGNRKQNMDVQATRGRSASQSVQQQSPVHIASLQALARKPVHSTSPRSSGQIVDRNQIGDDTISAGQQNGMASTQDSSQNRRVSQGLASGQQQQSLSQHQSVSLQSSPRDSPAPNSEQQSGPPGVPPKDSPAPDQGQGFGLPQPQSWQNPGGASQPSPISQQASVYRPSGPQIAAVVQSFSQQQPQSPWSIGRQNTGGQPGQLGQQFPPGQSPQSMMMTPAAQEQRPEKEGAFSKLLGKSKTFVYQISEPQPSNDKAKHEKESKGVKGMLGAFKRDKPKAQQQQQPEVGKAPPGGPQWNIQSGQTPLGTQQQQQQQPGYMPHGQPMPQRLPQMQMPPKAQQVMGIGEGEQKIVSTPDEMFPPQNQIQNQPPQGPAPSQPLPPQPRPEQQRTNSQPYLNYQKERQSPPKTSQPATQQLQQQQQQQQHNHHHHQPQQSQAQAGQQPIGRSSIGGSAPTREGSPSQQQQPQHQQQPQQSMGQNRSQMAAPASTMRAQNTKQHVAPHAPEPQYAPVPIPQGYVPVYGGEKPEMMRAPSYGQPYPGMVYQGHTQQWVYPGMLPGQVPQGVPPHMVQQGWPQYPYQGTPPPMMMAQHPPPPQQYMQGQQASPPPIQGQTPPPQMSMQHPPMHAQAMAPQTGQGQMATQQVVNSPHSAGFAPSQQGPPISFDQMQAMQHNGQLVAPQAGQHFAVVPESAPAPAQTSNDNQPQSYTLESTRVESHHSPSQAVPRSTFAVMKPMTGQDQLQPPQDPAGHLVPQRQLSGASEVSSLTSGPATSQGSTGAHSDHTVSQVQQPNGMLERSAASPEPAYERPPVTLKDEGIRMDTPVTSTSMEKDDIYGATPRQSVHATPVQPQAQHTVEHVIVPEPTIQEHSREPEVKFSGPPPNNRSPESKPTFKVEPPSQHTYVVDAPPVTGEPATPSTIPAPDSAPPSSTLSSSGPVATSKSPSHSEEEPPSPTESELGRKDKAGVETVETGEDDKAMANGKPVQSSAEIFEEHKRKQLLRDMEEKIAIFPTEPQALEPKKKDDDAPMMSATSYPGQEWNPYGDGWVEDDL